MFTREVQFKLNSLLKIALDDATAGLLMKAFLRAREEKDAIKAREKAALEPVQETLDYIEGLLLQKMQEQGVDNFKNADGTAYQSVTTRYKVEDWDAMLAWAMKNNMTDVLVHNVAKSAVDDFVEENNALPPGVSRHAHTNVRVRRS